MFFDFIKKKKNPNIIPYDIHKIKKTYIDPNALKIIYRLNNYEYDAYIVGGAIRDLLCGRKPKDFDVVTNATPRQIKSIFTNSRIIGKRFRLVHIYFGDSIIETATFRKTLDKNTIKKGKENENKESSDKKNEDKLFKTNKKTRLPLDNVFGTIEEDFARRDFTLNALYYDPNNETIIDFVGGYEDIKKNLINPMQDPSKSFKEDPVRMLRAVKYSTMLSFTIKNNVFKKIKKYASELERISTSRLYEEIAKIFKSRRAKDIFLAFENSGLLKYLMPFLEEDLKTADREKIIKDIEKLDKILSNNESININVYWVVLLLNRLKDYRNSRLSYQKQIEVTAIFKENLSKMNIPLYVIDYSTKVFILLMRLSHSIQKPNKAKLIKTMYVYEAIQILEIVSDDIENIMYLKSMDIKNFERKSKKLHYHFYRNSNNNRKKYGRNQNKAITTKNFYKKDR